MPSTETLDGIPGARRPHLEIEMRAGTRLGPFRIDAPLGAGGMGTVFRATDTRLERPVAVKVLPLSPGITPEAAHRLFREARASSMLSHPNVVTIFDVGLAKERGCAYIVMELVEGQRLDQLLAAGPLPLPRLLKLAVQIADGLASAHAKGIVHRDLKPANIMVTADDRIKLLDFGIATSRALEEASGRGEASGMEERPTPGRDVAGTRGYMSPEQARGEAADFRSDQFAFGAVLYEMATGLRAFTSPGGSASFHVGRAARGPHGRLGSPLPMALEKVMERCLATNADERYASTRDLHADILRIPVPR